jgi:hypothetical protein
MEGEMNWEEEEDNRSDSDSDVKVSEGHGTTEINMVFQLPFEFHLPETRMAQLDMGAERVVFEKPEVLEKHMRPLYVMGLVDGKLISWMPIDGGACINIMPCLVFEKLRRKEDELMRTNMTLSGFLGEVSDTRGIIFKELTVGTKTIPTIVLVYRLSGERERKNTKFNWGVTGYMPTDVIGVVLTQEERDRIYDRIFEQEIVGRQNQVRIYWKTLLVFVLRMHKTTSLLVNQLMHDSVSTWSYKMYATKPHSKWQDREVGIGLGGIRVEIWGSEG